MRIQDYPGFLPSNPLLSLSLALSLSLPLSLFYASEPFMHQNHKLLDLYISL